MKWLIFSVVIVVHASADKLTFRDLRDVKSLDSRIVGGLKAENNSFSYQVAILITGVDGKTSLCGGSLCSYRHVLTAAHCLTTLNNETGVPKYQNANYTIVVLGAHNIRDGGPGMEVLVSSNFVIHAEYNATTLQNDIALIVLERSVVPNGSINIIRMDKFNPPEGEEDPLMFQKTNVSGWGRVSTTGTISPVLQYVSLRIIPNLLCVCTYGKIVTKNQICQCTQEGKSTCFGDSGGPVVILNGTTPVQVGIVSFVHKDGCEVGQPIVQTRVSAYYDWIESYIKFYLP